MDDFIKNLPELPKLDGLGFVENRLSRHLIKRGKKEISEAYDDPRAKTYLIKHSNALYKKHDAHNDPLFSMSEANQFELSAYEEVLLGYDGEEPRFVMKVKNELEELPEHIGHDFIRSVAMMGIVEPHHCGALALGTSLLAWHRSHKFCAKCGNPSQIMDGGYRRLCTSCETEHFPRTDPVVIMLIVKDGHCLLGSGINFDETMFSALAGFMEPGETIEDAVRRETMEEASIEVGDVHYVTSQPWPMPHSLMIGCIGVAKSFDIKIDPEELRDCRWFSKDEIKLMLHGEHPDGLKTPPKFAIAASLIYHWLD